LQAALEGRSWIAGRLSLSDEYAILDSIGGKDELKPYRLSWLNPTEFVLSGTNRQLEIGRITISFPNEQDAKAAAAAILASGRVSERTIEPTIEQVPVEIRANALVGPYFLLFPVYICLVVFLGIFVSSDIFFQLAASVFVGFFFFWMLSTIFKRRMNSGPVVAWFRSRSVAAHVYVDEEDLVVNVFGLEEAFRVSRFEWIGDRGLKIEEGETSFQLFFENPDDATQIASMIRIVPSN
jgi:hypothetical protein